MRTVPRLMLAPVKKNKADSGQGERDKGNSTSVQDEPAEREQDQPQDYDDLRLGGDVVAK